MKRNRSSWRTIMLLVTSLCLISMGTLSAKTMVDGWRFLTSCPSFVSFVAEVKNALPVETVEASYELLLEKLPGSELTGQQQALTQAKANTMLSRYYTETKPKRTADAKRLLKEASLLLDTASEQELHEPVALTLEADIDSIWYLISSLNVSKGISSTKLTDRAWDLFPEEISVQLMKANRLLYAPPIGGGDTKQALQLFLELMEQARGQMAPWDLFSMYSGIGMACRKLGLDDRAIQYLETARQLYYGDRNIDDALAELYAKEKP
ncbi:MAG: hypothetical protein WCS18_03185 [Sphaerochaetaceae bacterium]